MIATPKVGVTNWPGRAAQEKGEAVTTSKPAAHAETERLAEQCFVEAAGDCARALRLFAERARGEGESMIDAVIFARDEVTNRDAWWRHRFHEFFYEHSGDYRQAFDKLSEHERQDIAGQQTTHRAQ